MRVASPAPAVCSACYQQKPDMTHVDFEAAWDGPVLEGHGDQIKVAIDDLVICEACLRTAAGLLPNEERDAEMEALQAEVDQLTARLSQKEDLAGKLRDALAANAKDREVVTSG